MKDYIFYGAGVWISNNFASLTNLGLHPVCFADSNIHKQYTKSFAGVDILPLQDALDRFPDSQIVITVAPEHYAQVYEYITSAGVQSERIFPLFKKELGCRLLGHSMILGRSYIWSCCIPERMVVNKNPIEPISSSDIINYYNACQTIADDLKAGKSTLCDGCNFLKEQWLPMNMDINTISLDSELDDTRCNARCVYCAGRENSRVNKISDGHNTAYNNLVALSNYYGNKPLNIGIYNGEISINVDCEKILALIKQNGWHVSVGTNAIRYVPSIAKLMQQNKASICVSLDSGTRETYRKIKQVDCFNKVITNLSRYAKSGSSKNILLKYIFLEGINDNLYDINSFVEIVLNLNCEKVALSSDTFATLIHRLNAQTMHKLLELGHRLMNSGIKLEITGSTFLKQDYLMIVKELQLPFS